MLNDSLSRTATAQPLTGIVHLPGNDLCRNAEAENMVGRTMFETDSLPTGWAERINLMDEIWVPASFNVQTFHAAGVNVPIEIVPEGVDASDFRPGLKPLSIPDRRSFVFLSVFEWSHRKAPDVLLDAWARAFRPQDDVCLVLRSYSRGSFDGDSSREINRLVDDQLAAFGFSRSQVAPIIILGRPLSPTAMPKLLTAADAYVGVSRGEGWGRHLLEAMATGLPTIGTRWGGNLDFMDDDNSLLIDIDGLEIIDTRMDLSFYHGQKWATPSREHLVDVLRRTAQDHNLRKQLARRARADVEKRWQWHQVCRIAMRRLKELNGSPSANTRAFYISAEQPRLRWRGDVFSDHSMATVNRELLQRIATNGTFAVEVTSTEIPPFIPEYRNLLKNIRGIDVPRSRGKADIEVRFAWPPLLTPSTASSLVVYQPWEFGGIPLDWISPMQTVVDEVWATSSWVKDCYVRSGIPSSKVAVLHHGVDVDNFDPNGPRLYLTNTRSIRLLYVGGTIKRKGFDLLLATYLKTFRPEDDVCLVVKPFGADTVYQSQNMDEQLRAVITDDRHPSIEIVDRRLSREEMAMLYRSCDVLVHPYRGEGFGLPIAEAMACGLPTVVTGYGSCLDFCDETTSWLLDAREVPAEVQSMPPSPAGYWLAEPDPDHLRHLLLTAVSDAAGRRAKGAAARARIAGSFSWDHAANQVISRLNSLLGDSTSGRLAG
ncbi:MAG: glycosyltransferase family 4 protein [Acidimicrobiales bacterium]